MLLLLCSCFYFSFVFGLCKRCLCLFHLVLHVCLELRKGLNTSSQLRYIYITLSVVSQSTVNATPLPPFALAYPFLYPRSLSLLLSLSLSLYLFFSSTCLSAAICAQCQKGNSRHCLLLFHSTRHKSNTHTRALFHSLCSSLSSSLPAPPLIAIYRLVPHLARCSSCRLPNT